MTEEYEGMDYNMDDAYEEPPIDEGVYGVEIRSGEMALSEKTGRSGIRVGMVITDSGDFEGRYLSDTIWLPMEEDRGAPFGKKKCDKFEGMLGMVKEKVKKVFDGEHADGNFSTKAFIESCNNGGECLNVKVKHQTEDQEGNPLERPREEVDRWYRPQ